MTLKGSIGEVRWGYHPAARLSSWTLEKNGSVGTFSAHLVNADQFRLAQSPLAVVVPTATATWRWALTDVQVSGSTLSATVDLR